MTTIQDLARIVPDVIERLEQIHRDMSRYKKRGTDFRANTLMREIEAKIRQIKKVHAAYLATPSYQSKNFDSWVAGLESYIRECRAIYERIMEYENVTGYN